MEIIMTSKFRVKMETTQVVRLFSGCHKVFQDINKENFPQKLLLLT
jgi:hypothetical protein